MAGVIQPKTLAKGLLGNASAILYTAPSAAGVTTAIIKEIWLANTDSADHTITLYYVESGGSIGDNRAIMKAVAIKANTTYIVSTADPLASAETVRGLADAADKISYRMSGIELAWV